MGTARPAPGLHRSTVKLTEHHSRVSGMPAIATARDERPLCPPAAPAVPPPPAATPPAHCTAGNNAILSWSVHLQVRVSSGISKCAGRYFGPGLPRPAGSHTAHTAPPPPRGSEARYEPPLPSLTLHQPGLSQLNQMYHVKRLQELFRHCELVSHCYPS